MATGQILYFVLSAALILAGLAGTVLPALPGVPLVFAGMLLAAWADHFAHVGTFTLIVLGALSLLALAVDFLAGLLGAKRVGASAHALWGAMLGTVVGLFLGLPGIVLGPFLGAVAGELLVGSALGRATHVGIGTWLGLLFGTLAKIALCFTMLGVFALAFVL
ncbi:MAG: DUF456 family protein [Rudaea sp.]|uniref:DUF456 domain-containing protein n=1 Tax=Rudaea sp. TaxID=2136325 RepID=UPI0039E5A8E3